MILPKIKEDIDAFSTAWVILDRKFLLPTQIRLILPDKVKIQDFKLSNIRANEEVEPRYFVGVKPPKSSGWKVEINPGAGGPEPAAAKRPRRAGEQEAVVRPARSQTSIDR
jgi:hypothetical protein